MVKVYFTFGSWEKFPHRNGYMIVEAEDFKDAIATYREKYPDITERCVNCSDFYSEEQWGIFGEYYKNQEPREVLISKRIKNQKRLVVLLENALMAVGKLGNDLELTFKEIGTDKSELAALGVNVEEVFKQ